LRLLCNWLLIIQGVPHHHLILSQILFVIIIHLNLGRRSLPKLKVLIWVVIIATWSVNFFLCYQAIFFFGCIKRSSCIMSTFPIWVVGILNILGALALFKLQSFLCIFSECYTSHFFNTTLVFIDGLIRAWSQILFILLIFN